MEKLRTSLGKIYLVLINKKECNQISPVLGWTQNGLLSKWFIPLLTFISSLGYTYWHMTSSATFLPNYKRIVLTIMPAINKTCTGSTSVIQSKSEEVNLSPEVNTGIMPVIGCKSVKEGKSLTGSYLSQDVSLSTEVNLPQEVCVPLKVSFSVSEWFLVLIEKSQLWSRGDSFIKHMRFGYNDMNDTSHRSLYQNILYHNFCLSLL